MIDIILKIIEWIAPWAYRKFKGATFEIWTEPKVIHIKNTGARTAYNFEIHPSENFLWTFRGPQNKDIMPGKNLMYTYSLVCGNTSGTLICKWTDKRGRKQNEYSYPIDL